jgi:BASS family bile acid:Na+ symporter
MTAEQLNHLINILASVTLFEMMVTIGLSVTLAEVAGVVRNWHLVGRAALANYVFFPAVAVGLLLAFRADPLVAAGFLIAAACPGAPYGPPFTGMARGNVVVAVGLMVLLAGSSAIVAPLLLHVLLPLTSGDVNVQIDAGKLVGTLLLAQFLPLCVGLAMRHWYPTLAVRLKRPAGRLSMVLNVATLALVVTVQFDMLVGIPVRAFAGMAALVFAGLAAGWLLGGPAGDTRITLAMATAVRNVGVSLVIATQSFPGTPAVTAAIAFAIFQTVLLAVVALSWGRLTVASGRGTMLSAPSSESVAEGTVS